MSRSSNKRTARVASLVHQVLAEVIASDIKDPRVHEITITDVEISGDLREARVFFSHTHDEAEEAQIFAGLERATGFLRRALGDRIRLRVTPSLDFRIDRSLSYGARIDRALKDLGLGGSREPGADDAE